MTGHFFKYAKTQGKQPPSLWFFAFAPVISR